MMTGRCGCYDERICRAARCKFHCSCLRSLFGIIVVRDVRRNVLLRACAKLRSDRNGQFRSGSFCVGQGVFPGSRNWLTPEVRAERLLVRETLQVIFLCSVESWLAVPVAGNSSSCLAILPSGSRFMVCAQCGMNGVLRVRIARGGQFEV